MNELDMSYKSVENVPNGLLDFLLVLQIPRDILVHCIKQNTRFQRRMGFRGFRPENLELDRLYHGFARHLEKEPSMFAMLVEGWLKNMDEEVIFHFESFSREEFIEEIQDVFDEYNPPFAFTLMRILRPDFHDLLALMLTDWEEEFGLMLKQRYKFTYEKSFQEVYGKNPFAFEEDFLDFLEEEEEVVEDWASDEVVNDEELSDADIIGLVIHMLGKVKERVQKGGLGSSSDWELQELDRTIRELDQTKTSQAKTIVDLHKRIQQLEKGNKSLEDRLERRNQENGKLGATIGQLREEVQSAKEEFEVLKAENRKLLLEATAKGSTVQKSLEKKTKGLEKAEEQLAQKNQEVQALKESLARVKEHHKEALRKLEEELEKERKTTKGKLKVADTPPPPTMQIDYGKLLGLTENQPEEEE